MQDQINQLLAVIEAGRPMDTETGSATQQLDWITRATDEEVSILLDALLQRQLPGDAVTDGTLSILFHQLALRFRAVQPEGGRAALPTSLLGKLAELHGCLPAAGRARSYLLQILSASRQPAALAELAKLFSDAPPPDSQGAALALGPLFQFRDYDPAPLFPRLFEAISRPWAAASVVDLANFVTREELVTEHPGADRRKQLAALLGDLAQRLGVMEETPQESDGTHQQVAERVEQAVSLAVSLCDALTLIGDPESVGKLYQALEVAHRRLRTEAAAGLARFGEAAGEEALLELAAEPVTRLRVLSYAGELGLEDKIDEAYTTPTARAEAELALWLAQPGQLGLPPTNLESIDSRTLFWPGYDEPMECFLFRFGYHFGDSAYESIGIAGPLTYAFAADMADLPPDDIYAAFAGWQAEHEEIFEVRVAELNEAQRVDVARFERRLHDAGYDAIQPVSLGSFFGDRALVARAVIHDSPHIAVADANDIIAFRSPPGPRAIGPAEAYAIYKGRKMLQSFNE